MSIEERWHNIALIEKRPHNTVDAIKRLFLNQRVCVCDFYVQGSEQGRFDSGSALHYDDLLIIDHHAPVPSLMQHISSAVIATTYVRRHGPLDDDWVVVINHTDADSLLAALIMTGVLPPDEEYAEAAIAADHTGAENLIADVLQALEDDRSIATSVAVLFKIVKHRSTARRALRATIAAGQVQWINDVAYLVLEQRIDAGLVPALLPDAKVIVVASPMEDGPKAWRIRVRLGLNAQGIALNQLNLPDFGGRWNAGSTTRYGGTDIAPADYARLISDAIAQQHPHKP